MRIRKLELKPMRSDPYLNHAALSVANAPLSQIQQMQNKIDELIKEIRDLKDKNQNLLVELTILRESQRVVEEHKGEGVYDVPPYEEPSQEQMALMGVEDTCNVIFHA